MLAIILPFASLLVGFFIGRWRRRGRGSPVIIGGGVILIGPQAQLLQAVGLSPATAWLLAIAIMVTVPLIGYLLGWRLWDRGEPPAGAEAGGAGRPEGLTHDAEESPQT